MDHLAVHVGSKFVAYFTVGCEIHRPSEQVFQVELGAVICAPIRWAGKLYQDANVAAVSSLGLGEGTKECEARDTEPPLKRRFVFLQRTEDLVPVHRPIV